MTHRERIVSRVRRYWFGAFVTFVAFFAIIGAVIALTNPQTVPLIALTAAVPLGIIPYLLARDMCCPSCSENLANVFMYAWYHRNLRYCPFCATDLEVEPMIGSNAASRCR
jgi:hypothetical protein